MGLRHDFTRHHDPFVEGAAEREHRLFMERLDRELHRLKAIAAFPAFLDVAAEPVDVSQPEPEPRIPTARRSGCRSRGRRPLWSRPGVRR